MAETENVTIVQNTQEEVALKLAQLALLERGYDVFLTGGSDKPPMKELLDVYAECLKTVKNPSTRLVAGKAQS